MAMRSRNSQSSRTAPVRDPQSLPWRAPDWTSDVTACIGCDSTTDRDLFCSDICAEMGRLVRYRRRTERDGRIRRADVREALAIKEAHVLWGQVYFQRLSPEFRRSFLEHRGFLCAVCGGKAEHVDHIQSAHFGDDSEANLQALCAACHRKKTFTSTMPWDTTSAAARAAHRQRTEDYQARCRAGVPLRACDDEEYWPDHWQAIATRRRRLRRAEAGRRQRRPVADVRTTADAAGRMTAAEFVLDTLRRRRDSEMNIAYLLQVACGQFKYNRLHTVLLKLAAAGKVVRVVYPNRKVFWAIAELV